MSNTGGDHSSRGEQANQPVLCANGCGFFGNPASSNMCSKCYRDYCGEQERSKKGEELISGAGLQDLVASPAPVAATAAAPVATACAPAPEAIPEAEAGPSPGDDRPVQKNKSRCFCCNKKVGLLGFRCKCDLVLCGQHRHAEAHACTFDWKNAGREELAKNNPLVAATKIDKF